MERRKAFVVAGAVTLSAFAGASALGATTGLLGFGGDGTEPVPAAASAAATETRIVHLPGRVVSTTVPAPTAGGAGSGGPSVGASPIAKDDTGAPVVTTPPAPAGSAAAPSSPTAAGSDDTTGAVETPEPVEHEVEAPEAPEVEHPESPEVEHRDAPETDG